MCGVFENTIRKHLRTGRRNSPIADSRKLGRRIHWAAGTRLAEWRVFNLDDRHTYNRTKAMCNGGSVLSLWITCHWYLGEGLFAMASSS